ncbi:MAG: DUF177 domain-containing protein [Rhodospirillales bacterium]|nr:DUF177 domain-containing protein [Rhodospirillales bacterium]
MTQTPAFSRPFQVALITEAGKSFRIAANADERKSLCERLSLPAIDELIAEGRLVKSAGGAHYRLEARLKARFTQTCVVSLSPVSNTMDVAVTRVFGTEVADEWADVAGLGAEVVLSEDGEDFVEPIADGVIDVGDVIAEQLALELEPFPRAPGAEYEWSDEAAEDTSEEPSRRSPFQALAAWKNKPDREK